MAVAGLKKNNLFALGYVQTFHQLLRSAKKDGITFSRAGFAGSSSYPTFWAEMKIPHGMRIELHYALESRRQRVVSSFGLGYRRI